jgi:hypothetical protein
MRNQYHWLKKKRNLPLISRFTQQEEFFVVKVDKRTEIERIFREEKKVKELTSMEAHQSVICHNNQQRTQQNS